MRRFLTAAVTVMMLAASCAEQTPDKYLAPEFGRVEVSLNGLAAEVCCTVSRVDGNLSCGFLLEENGGRPREIISAPQGGQMKAELKGLLPTSEYVIKAFATNGINKVYSDEERFKPDFSGTVVNIPDPVFKQFLLDSFDGNNDGQISADEAKSVSKISVCTDNISSLEGIQYFVNINELLCNGSGVEEGLRKGKLTSVDLSKNIHLRYFELDGNNLEELILPKGASDIEEVHCVVNNLKSLDLSGCPKLRAVYCWNNNLTSLDLSHNPFLTDLRCMDNEFYDGLDLSHNEELRILICSHDYLQSLSLSNNTKLTWLDCSANLLTVLDLSAAPNLTYLVIYGDEILETVYVHKDIDISRLDIGSDDNVHASIEHKQ